jgi:hypothetical protein
VLSRARPTICAAEAVKPALGTPTSTGLLASMDAVSAAALIANADAVTTRSGVGGALLVGGITVVLALKLLFALGTPWRGPIGISGCPLDAVVQDVNGGYFTPDGSSPRAVGRAVSSAW